MDKLTVVMLNWQRPRNVYRLIKAYLAMPVVARIIIADCSGTGTDYENNPFEAVPLDSRLLYLRFNQDPGLVSRFAAAALSRTEAVLLTDDDIDLPQQSVNKLMRAWEADTRRPRSLVGVFGRRVSGGYDSGVTDHGPVEVLLTRAVIADRSLCALAAEHTMKMAQTLGGDPFGNGEDIVLSYTALARAGGRRNTAVPAFYRNLGYDDRYAISVRYKGHTKHRNRVVQWCREHIHNDLADPVIKNYTHLGLT